MYVLNERTLAVQVEEVDGGLAVTSADLPELILFSFEPKLVYNDLLPTVERLLAANHGVRVRASVIPEGTDRPTRYVTSLRPGTHRLHLEAGQGGGDSRSDWQTQTFAPPSRPVADRGPSPRHAGIA